MLEAKTAVNILLNLLSSFILFYCFKIYYAEIFYWIILIVLRGRGEVWSSRLPVTQEVAGSNPVVPAIRPDSSVGRALV